MGEPKLSELFLDIGVTRMVPAHENKIQIGVVFSCFFIGGAKSMAMKFHGNVCGKVRVNFLALFASKPHTFFNVVPSECSELFVRMFV